MHKVLDDGYLLAENVSLPIYDGSRASYIRDSRSGRHSGSAGSKFEHLQQSLPDCSQCWNRNFSLLLIGIESGDLPRPYIAILSLSHVLTNIVRFSKKGFTFFGLDQGSLDLGIGL